MNRKPTVTTLSPAEIWAEVVKHRGLCGRIAKEFYGRGLDHDDLVQEGCFGVYRAIELFEPDGRAQFSTYAVPWIRQKMGQACKDQGRLVRVPGKACQDACRVAKGELDTRALTRSRQKIVSAALHATVYQDDGDLGHLMARADRIDEAELTDAMDLLATLPDREREVIERRCLGGELLREVGESFGLTRERVRQVQERGLRRVREAMAC